MSYPYFTQNGTILPISQAVVPLSDIHYSYGFGVYETIRVSNGIPCFLAEHSQRLINSAKIISLDHEFSLDFVAQSVKDLITKNKAGTCNLKILLIGGATKETANIYILCLRPMFPDRKLYKMGVTAITQSVERDFPQAKTLNMLPSYLAFRQAKVVGAYDALLVNHHGCITEGTRTNFFAMKDRTIFTPPTADILLGITREHVLQVAQQNNFEVVEQIIKLTELADYDSFFLTSTSSKIMAVRAIDDLITRLPSDPVQELTQAFNQFLEKQSLWPT